MENKIEEVTADIEAILLKERAFLATGKAASALALGEEKGAAIENFEKILRLSAGKVSARKMQHYVKKISNLAKENELHLLAVRNGLKGLMARLENTDRSSRAGVYNQNGEEICFNGAVGGYLRKV